MHKAEKEELLKNAYSIVAVRDDLHYTSTANGIKPVLLPMREDRAFFHDCLVVDRIIGKASASLLILSGAKEVYGLVMSESAVEILKRYDIPYRYDTLVPYIINRKGDDMCPMEKTVRDIEEPEEAFEALDAKLASMGV